MSVSSGPPCSAASTSRQSRGSKVSETWRGRGSGATVMPTRIVGATASATGSRALAPGEAGDSGGGIAAQPPVGEHVHALLADPDRKSTRLNSSHVAISYAVFCLKKK